MSRFLHRFHRMLCVGLLLAACATPPAPAPGPAPTPAPPGDLPPEEDGSPEANRPLVVAVVSTANLHGEVASRSEKVSAGAYIRTGGIALIGGYVENLRESLDGRVVLVDGGDTWQGALLSTHSKGEAMVAAMNAVGWDAAILGNHEFDWGVKTLQARVWDMSFPLLVANLLERKTGKPPAWENVKPWTMVEAGDIRIGVLGGTTVDTPRYQPAGALEDLEFLPLAETIKEWAPKVREAGAEAVVAVVHEDGACESAESPRDLSTCDPDSRLFRLARALSPGTVDLLVGAGSHGTVAHRVAGTPVIQAAAKGRYLARADLVFDPMTRRLRKTEIHPPVPVCASIYRDTGDCVSGTGRHPLTEATYAGSRVKEHGGVPTALAPFEERVRVLLATPVGAKAATPLTRSKEGESLLGNVVADALRAAVPGAQVALQNSGGLRADIDAGPITHGELHAVLPFGNTVASLKLTGAQLWRLLTIGTGDAHGVTQVSGLRMVLDATKRGCPGEEVLASVTLTDGTPLDPEAELLVATNGYLARGGGGFSVVTGDLPEGAVEVFGDRLVRDAVATWLKGLDVDVNSEKRPLLDPVRPRIRIRDAGRPQRCGRR